jgi:hypothetical protein
MRCSSLKKADSGWAQACWLSAVLVSVGPKNIGETDMQDIADLTCIDKQFPDQVTGEIIRGKNLE